MRYEILKSFLGSQDGSISEPFEAGTVREISDYLAQCAPHGSIRPEKGIKIENKAIITDAPKGRMKAKAI